MPTLLELQEINTKQKPNLELERNFKKEIKSNLNHQLKLDNKPKLELNKEQETKIENNLKPDNLQEQLNKD